MKRSNRIYTIALLVLGFFFVIAAAEFLLLQRSPAFPASSRWAFQFCAFAYALYAAAIIVTLILRSRTTTIGRIATTALNIVLLPLIPFGTIIGIYGLRKVDKAPQGN